MLSVTHRTRGIVLQRKKDPAAVKLGRKGGEKRAEKLTPLRRSEIARKAAEQRWKKEKGDQSGPS